MGSGEWGILAGRSRRQHFRFLHSPFPIEIMAIHELHTLPPHLVEIQGQMEQHARNYGLDFFPTIFELVDADQLNAIAAYGGFPTRYPHWRFGMEYEQL